MTCAPMQAVNANGKRVNKTVTVLGKKQPLSLCRMIFKLAPDAPWPPPGHQLLTDATSDALGSPAAQAPPVKSAPAQGAQKGKGKRSKGRKAAATSATGDAEASTSVEAAEAGAAAEARGLEVGVPEAQKVFSEELPAGKGSTFELEAVREPFANAGRFGARCCTWNVGTVSINVCSLSGASMH